MKQCSCCLATFSTGKDYGDKWMQGFGILTGHELGLCEFCNPKHRSFCCPKHGVDYKIGNITYKANESNITV